jgi:hypothetical protein
MPLKFGSNFCILWGEFLIPSESAKAAVNVSFGSSYS